MGRSCSLWESHGSSQMLISSPVPIIQPSCLSRRSLPIRTLLQPCEAIAGVLQVKKDFEWQYLPSKQRARSDDGFYKMRHPNFASNESLKEVIFLNPSPHFFSVLSSFPKISTPFCVYQVQSPTKSVELWIECSSIGIEVVCSRTCNAMALRLGHWIALCFCPCLTYILKTNWLLSTWFCRQWMQTDLFSFYQSAQGGPGTYLLHPPFQYRECFSFECALLGLFA